MAVLERGSSCSPDSFPLIWDCRALFYAIRGFWLGVLVTLALEAWLVWRVLAGPAGSKPRVSVMKARRSEEDLASSAADLFPENIVAWLRKATMPSGNTDAAARGMVDASPTESCFFLNVYVHRYFLELRRSELLKARWKLKVFQKLATRMESLSLISSLTCTDFDFGVDPPVFHGARVLKYYSDKSEITLELDTTYKGGLKIGVEVTLAAGGITIPVVVKLTGLAGRMRIRVPSRIDPLHFDITFAEDPNATFEVVSGLYLKDNEYLKETLTKYLNSKVSKLFSDFWTYPAWRNLELPMINRKVTDPIDIPKYVGVVREMVDGKPAGHVWTSGKLTNVPTTASGTAIGVGVTGAKAGTLIRKSAASSASVPDVLADAVFPLDVVVRSANVDQLQTKLSTTFLQLIKEDTKIAGKGLEAWKTIKSKDGIVHQRKKILLPGTVAGSALTASEFNRTMFRVNVDPERAFQILSKPEHQRLITDSFSGAIEIKRFDENSTVWFYKYRFGKTPTADRLIKVLEFRRKRISLSQDSETNMSDSTVKGAASRPVAWMVVYRSISSITPDEEPQGIAESLESIPPPVGGDDFGDVTRPQRDVEDASQSRIDQDFGVEEAAQPSTDDWAESLEDRELAESLRAFASQSSLTKSEISPLVSIAKGEAPPVLPLVPGIAVAPTPPATPAVGPGDSVPQQIPLPKAPQPLNQSSSASSMSSNSGRGTGSPAPAGSRLPSIIGRAAAGGADKGTVVKGDGGFPLDDPLHVHVYGYFVESIPDDPHGCNVTMLTQYSSKSIQRLESSWDIGRQLKNSIEELATLSSALPNDGAGDDPALQTVARRNRSGRPLSGADEEGKAPSTSGQRMDRLKSLASDAGKKAYSWWSGKSGSQSSTIGNAVAAGAVISSTFESPDNTLSSSKLLADSAHVHTVAFDDLDSDDDGTSEYDYRSDDDGGTLPKEAMRRTRVGRLLMRKAADKTGSLRPPEEAGEVASLHSQADEGEAVEARSLAESLDDDASGLRDAESMTGLSDVGPPAGLGFTGVPSAPERSERPGPSDIRKNAFQEFAITAKQGARLDVGFNGDFSTATELAWEFKVRSPDAVNFAVLFKPTMGKRISTSSLGGTDDRFLRNLADSELEPGAKIVVPLTPVFAMTRAVRGRIATSGFPAGIFVVLWDNAYHRKTDKTLAYRVRLQPIRVHSTPRIPRPHFSQEMSSAVVVRTRSAFRVQLFYTEEVERLSVHGAPSPSQNPDRGQTYIQWEFSTGGSDIFFKIYYTPAEPDYLGTIRASTSEHPVDGTVPLVAPALPPRAIPAPGAALPLAPSGLGSSPPTTPRSLPIAPSADSARSLSSSPVSLGPPATIPDAPSGRSLSWGPAVSSLATVSAPGTAAVPPTPPSRNVVIVPQVKCNSAKGSISGSLLITGKTGIYTFVWDNTASLVTNKHIAFRAGTLTFT